MGAVAANCPIADRRCRRWTPAMPRGGLRQNRRRLPVPRTTGRLELRCAGGLSSGLPGEQRAGLATRPGSATSQKSGEHAEAAYWSIMAPPRGMRCCYASRPSQDRDLRRHAMRGSGFLRESALATNQLAART